MQLNLIFSQQIINYNPVSADLISSDADLDSHFSEGRKRIFLNDVRYTAEEHT